MPFNNNITPGRPPVLWSEVNDAFLKVNENFDILVATIGNGSGLTPIDFTSLNTSVKPTTSSLYDLGDITHQWRSVFTAEHTASTPLNGLWAGSAQVKGVGYTINLPTGSTVGGDPVTGIGTSLIIDPNKTFFKEIQVNNDLSVVATTFGDTVNFLSGSGVGLAVSSGADSITFSNTGVLSVTAGAGITTSTASGVATITNAGVRSLQSTTALPSGRTTGAGIYINGSTGDNLRITNAGVISISSGVGITVSADAATGDVTITNSAPAVNAFTQIQVNGDSGNRIQADAVSDVLNINSGQGITLTKNVVTDTLTITVNPVFDLKGSIFGDNSTKIVDAVENKVYGGIFATTLRTEETAIALGADANADINSVSIGNSAGALTPAQNAVAVGNGAGYNTQGGYSVAVGSGSGAQSQGTSGVAVGASAGSTNQGARAVAIGAFAGNNYQGDNSIAIGYNAGRGAASQQAANTIILNATASEFNGVALQTNSFYVNPIRATANGTPLMYNSTTKEITYSTVLEFIGSTISTNDSSGLTVDVQTTFNTAVTFDSDIAVNGQATIGGNLLVNGVGVTAASFTGAAANATNASTAASVGYMGLPQSATTTTLVIGDAGKHIYVNTSGQTLTIPAATSVAYPIGTTITFIAGPSASTVTIAITTDTMYLVGTGTTGSRTLAAHGMATAVKVSGASSSGVWYINGSGLT
jgi:hypothetical protein